MQSFIGDILSPPLRSSVLIVIFLNRGDWLSITSECASRSVNVFIMLIVMTRLAQIFKPAMIKCNVWIIYILCCQQDFMMHDIPYSFLAPFAHSSVYRYSFCYVTFPATLPGFANSLAIFFSKKQRTDFL